MNYHILSDYRRAKLRTISLASMLAVVVLLFAIPSSWAQEDQSITIATSKSTYGPGDTVNITGTVNGGTPGQLVAIQIKDSKGSLILIRTVQADQNGNFGLSFKVPDTVPSGGISITASARINGFVVTQSTGIATPVPEFPTSGLVFAVGIGLIVTYRMFSSQGFGQKKGF